MRINAALAGSILMAVISLSSEAQRIKVTEGDLAFLNGQSSINTEFTYDNIRVGKYDKEEDYVNKKVEDYNKKEPGRGDNWKKSWVNDREFVFQPKFDELFSKHSGLGINKNAKYTLIFKTTFMEPGFNIYITRKNARIDADVWFVETGNKDKVLAKLSVDDALGRTFGGNDYDTGVRLAEAYADAGKALGKKVKP